MAGEVPGSVNLIERWLALRDKGRLLVSYSSEKQPVDCFQKAVKEVPYLVVLMSDVVSVDDDQTGAGNQFSIKTKGKTIRLECISSEEKGRWMKSLKCAYNKFSIDKQQELDTSSKDLIDQENLHIILAEQECTQLLLVELSPFVDYSSSFSKVLKAKKINEFLSLLDKKDVENHIQMGFVKKTSGTIE